jgi:hypothetical protein
MLKDWYVLVYEHLADEKIKPTVASRIYAYMGVAAYESSVYSVDPTLSLVGRLNGLDSLPRPVPGKTYDWPTVTASALYLVTDEVMKSFLSAKERSIINLRDRQLAMRQSVTDPDTYQRSVAFGESLSKSLQGWIKQDRFSVTRLQFYKPPTRTGFPERWEPTDRNQGACEPYWTTIRTFATTGPDVCPKRPPIAFSTVPDSEFGLQAKVVLDTDMNLTEEQRQIALFWSDDPGETATPSGHWTRIMNQFVDRFSMDLFTASRMYCFVGVAMADAFIQCWTTKYEVNLVRPVTYIRENLGHPHWEPLLETPSFPEFTSGHSVVTSAGATVLTALLGDTISFTDTTHNRIGLRPRSFKSIWQAADEACISRLYGGIHYPMAISEGQQQGRCIGEAVLRRLMVRPKK